MKLFGTSRSLRREAGRRPRRSPATKLLLLCLGGVATLAGCGKTDRDLTYVEGRVTYQGKPVSGGTVSFTPHQVAIGAPQRPTTSITDDNGVYRVKAFRDQFGMAPGDYAVSVLWYEGSMAEPESVQYLVPRKYSDAQTSGLSASIPESAEGPLKLDFELQ